MKGLIFSVKKYSVHDGPGIRVTFFMKGCPLNCRWCHNPEGISPTRECVDLVHKIGEREFIEKTQAGEYYSLKDILEILDKDEVFIKHSGGGVTFSGGEPLLQHEFLLSALQNCRRKGYHTAVDTSGYAPQDRFISILPYTDLFLFDIKHMDEQRHIELTGLPNRLILSNYRQILNSGKDVMVRYPVIPGYNDEPANLERTRSFIIETKNENLKKICLLPYHRTGASKYKRFGMEYRMEGTEQPSAIRMNELKKYFEETGIKVKIGG
jgi:pyruvate formate lyase activating enzyme